MKKTKRQRQRQEKQSTRPQVISHRSWSKKSVRIFDKQFDRSYMMNSMSLLRRRGETGRNI